MTQNQNFRARSAGERTHTSNDQYKVAQTDRATEDLCNICQQQSTLTWDHVPPKGSCILGKTKVSMRPSLNLAGEPKLRESQNGLKFRTLCRECNNFLGSKYDPEIMNFAHAVKRCFEVRYVHLPSRVLHLPVKVQRLMKGIVGHLLAAKADLDGTNFETVGRKYVLNEKEPLPTDINLFYWMYPYYDLVHVRRDFVMFWPRGTFKTPVVFQTLKYFPVAYLVCDKPQYASLNSLSRYRHAEIDDLVEIPIELDSGRDEDWPDAPSEHENNVVLVGNSGLKGIEARKM